MNDNQRGSGQHPGAETCGKQPGGEHEMSRESVEGMSRSKEIGGRKGPEPTRYGDWEKNGRCIDF